MIRLALIVSTEVLQPAWQMKPWLCAPVSTTVLCETRVFLTGPQLVAAPRVIRKVASSCLVVTTLKRYDVSLVRGLPSSLNVLLSAVRLWSTEVPTAP